ncbi:MULTISPECIES: HD domain-containing protein [unclassified Lentimicrobium]|uniref:HD domain-containing protein n=1 Tax=unclassified Lentimicrobium TaxID=2677434 RepID=UPI0015533853|nr:MULTISPECIES: HD domain-containing protein [unclassified Lentimicrobium]NPD47557.1 HD domain-containing protein [Lentimicrobium sp. S6]NPD86352.1 HD domain-containing protein [Lentimicrobium sp. L6]
MKQIKNILETEKYIRGILEGEGSGHDWWHIHRVRNNAMNIAKAYEVDIFIVEMAALLHDIADHKLNGGDEEIGPRMAGEWLDKNEVGESEKNHILLIMQEVSFSKGKVPATLEGKIVQDADRLDAIGAIGIARTFAFGGFKKREIYNPEIQPIKYASLEDYKKNTNPTLNHFYEKLLLLKDMMNTEEAKKIAQQRHDFMETYLEQFYAEWEGEL